jgi:hypothetical protein
VKEIRPALAWALTGLSLLLAVATIVFALLDPTGDGSGVFLGILFLLIPLSFSGVGGLLALRRPGNCIGWLCLAIGLMWSVLGAGYGYATWAGDTGRLGAAEVVGLSGSLWFPAAGLTGTHLALRLPTGSLLSPRWRWYSRFCTGVLVLVALIVVTEPGRVADVPGTTNPIGSESIQALGPLFLLVPVSVFGAIWSLVRRYRRAGGVERLQIRWIAFGGVFFLGIVCLVFIPTLLGAANGSAPRVVEGLAYVGYSALPLAIGVSVLRYRLYDLDVVVNRALVYGALTATLAAAYLGSVLSLQLVLHSLTADSNLAIAVATLAVAWLFRPARARIQSAVDRRFYRRKYDAQRTLEAFSLRLRDEVDLRTLHDELGAVVRETLQPAHVSLWLQGPR